ncbi:hypothetical protein G7054_g2861 [Neopestalotiopsis clavispora]|nr:hypothetical protein G7054_g2861 [Neopestalotiopsis clavispora]
MSGFEVAGLVLGVLPLAIKTINSYRSTLSSIRTAQDDLNWLRRDLETEQVRLQNTCEILLHDLLPLSMVDAMIKDPFGADWAKYDEKLRERLWLSWGTFQAQVQLLSAAATELEAKLCVNRNGSIKLNDYKKILKELSRRTSFTLRKGDYEALLSKIKSSNTILHSLARQDNNLESSRRRRSQARVIKLLRGLSESIFNAMRTAITCDCSGTHKIGIELATRYAVLLPDDDEDEVATKFHYNVVIDSVKAPTKWNRAELQLDKSILLSKKMKAFLYHLGTKKGFNCILHAYNTPWLSKTVTLDDIAFLWGEEAQTHPEWWKDPYRPVVTRHISVSNWQGVSFRAMDCPRMINITILSLGILLVQIITGTVMERLELPTVMSLEEVYSRRESASRLEAKVIENGGPNYAKAVTWCFDHAIGLPGFQNEKFCQEFYEVVIGTLEEDAALLDEQSRT